MNDSVLDLSFSSSSLIWSLALKILYDGDHCLIIIDYVSSRSTIYNNISITNSLYSLNSFNFNKANCSKFYDFFYHIRKLSSYDVFGELSYNYFNDLLLGVARKTIPIKKMYRNNIKSSIWWNFSCIEAIKIRF